MRRLIATAALTAFALVGHASLLAPAVDAECLPCVWVSNDDPYLFVEVCPPV